MLAVRNKEKQQRVLHLFQLSCMMKKSTIYFCDLIS